MLARRVYVPGAVAWAGDGRLRSGRPLRQVHLLTPGQHPLVGASPSGWASLAPAAWGVAASAQETLCGPRMSEHLLHAGPGRG